MTNELWRYGIAIFLVVHGIGHLAGYWWPSYSWLLTGRFGDPLVRTITLGLWLLALNSHLSSLVGALAFSGRSRFIEIEPEIEPDPGDQTERVSK